VVPCFWLVVGVCLDMLEVVRVGLGGGCDLISRRCTYSMMFCCQDGREEWRNGRRQGPPQDVISRARGV
jgi:hypothetical protein